MSKRIGFIILMILIFIAAISLIRQTTEALQAGTRLDKATEELTALQDQNRQLKNRLTNVQTVNFVEEQARNKLNLARPNETIVIIAQADINALINPPKSATESAKPYWQGWLDLFF